MTYATCSQAVYSTVSATLSPYISNVIRDHKTPRDQKGSAASVHMYLQIYTLFGWIGTVFDVFLYVTLQVQFILPAFLVDAAATAYFTRGYIAHEAQSGVAQDLLP